ncbi:MAG: ankyrin repeat domain-containing protein [Magnetospirillum sp.]|nr:ankyrin repeat domain-containing protein [Magnetospirillum sp.]
MRIVVLVLTLSTLVFLGWLLLTGGGPRTVPVRPDPRQGAYTDPRRVLARIQTDLERAAVGRQAGPLPAGMAGDPLEAIVDAYRLFRDGNVKAMDVQLNAIEALATERLRPAAGMGDGELRRRTLDYFAALAAAHAPQPLTRLAAAMRMVDSILFMEAAGWGGADPQTRRLAGAPDDPRNDSWLRLPCRTAIGRTAAMAEAQARLGERAGPLLSCPTDNADLAVVEAQARAPAMLPPRIPPIPPRPPLARAEPPPPAPWDHEIAVAWMDEDMDAAEAVLAAGTSPAGKLDYALFLHAFRPASPDNQARIHALLRTVDAASLPGAEPAVLETVGKPAGYDGSDSSLLASLRLAALTDTAPGYAIPCAVLQAKPGLLAATKPLFVGSRDNFLPVSGCASGRGHVRGFPEAEVAALVAAAEEADGHFIARHDGTIVASHIASQQAALERLKLDPRTLAAAEPPTQDHPYQVWGLLSLGNRAVENRITALYREAAGTLSAWYLRQGLSADEAARAAKTGLFRVVWGADCGADAPTPSLRGLIMERAPLADIRDALAGKEAPEVTICAIHAGLDPLSHVAVGHPPALALLLERGRDADEANSFGKTPLMAAAQADAVESARLLLDHGAAINATTWMAEGAGLAHDGRTALMYAAASGSLSMIKVLLAKGADPQMADTKGRRAIDYLLGFGPVPANTVLSPEERAEAARLLY